MKSRLPASSPSIFSLVTALAKEHSAINLGQGFPDFDCDERLRHLITKYLNEGHNQYAPMAGALELRKAIAEKITVCYEKVLDPLKEICITAGATQALNTAIQAFVLPGDEVVIIEPAYDSYRPSIKMAGGIVVPYKITAPDYKIDWEALGSLVSDKTAMLIVNTPHNPTGTVLGKEDMEALEKLVLTNDLVLLSDEVYEHLIFDQLEHQSVLRYPNLYKKSLATFSFGKTLHATGWKLGYIVGPPDLMDIYKNHHQWVVFSANSFIQQAIAEYLSDPNTYLSLPSFFQEKRNYLQSKLLGSPLKPLTCSGTYFQLYDYSEMRQENDLLFMEWLIKEKGVACIPLSPFYEKPPGDKVVRLCFAKSEETLDNAVQNLMG